MNNFFFFLTEIVFFHANLTTLNYKCQMFLMGSVSVTQGASHVGCTGYMDKQQLYRVRL